MFHFSDTAGKDRYIFYHLLGLVVLSKFLNMCCLIKFVLITFSDRFIILCNEAIALKDSVSLTQESGLMREKLRKHKRCQPLSRRMRVERKSNREKNDFISALSRMKQLMLEIV